MKIRPIHRNIPLLLVILLVSSCVLKSKTELYLERGLDILSNKKQVEFTLAEGVEILEVGVIRDQEEEKKVIVLRMAPETTQAALDGYEIGLRARIRTAGDSVRVEHWDFLPVLLERRGHKYITRDILLEEDKIQKLYVYLYRAVDGEKQRQGRTLTINNLWTYND